MHDMPDLCTTCYHPRCHIDAAGWCQAHGWQCDEYHVFVQEQLSDDLDPFGDQFDDQPALIED